MIDDLKSQIEAVNSNLETLPVNNKRARTKYLSYVDDCIKKYTSMLDEATSVLKERYDAILGKYKDLTYPFNNEDFNYNLLKLTDPRSECNEKINLDYLLYKLNHTDNNLNEVNKIITEIISLFTSCGVILKDKDFNHSEAVNKYMKALYDNSDSTQDVFNEIFWKNSDLIVQIELNFKYLYYKNEKKLNVYFKNMYSKFDYNNYINSHRVVISNNELLKHQSSKYIFDLFMDKSLSVEEYLSESKMQDLLSSLLIDTTSNRNYENLIKLKNSLLEYKGYSKYEFIFNDFKELFSHKEEYKNLFSTKLKEINKKEKELFSINKKINKTGLFKLNKVKLADAKTKRNAIFNELITFYNELDELKIKETINKYITNDTNYYDMLVFTSYNFLYFVKLLKVENENITVDDIEKKIKELKMFIYDNNLEILKSISISEEKDLPKIISEMYKMNSIIVNEDKINISQIDSFISDVDKTLIYYDIKSVKLNLKDIKFLLSYPNELKNDVID